MRIGVMKLRAGFRASATPSAPKANSGPNRMRDRSRPSDWLAGFSIPPWIDGRHADYQLD